MKQQWSKNFQAVYRENHPDTGRVFKGLMVDLE